MNRCLIAMVIVFFSASTLAAYQASDPAGSNPLPTQNPQYQTANGPQQIAPPQPPPGFPLDAANQDYIQRLLQYWEGASSQIERYQCDFTRWEFDPMLCNWRNPQNNHLAARTISKGQIRYQRPDNGMYEVHEKWHFIGPPKQPGEQPDYQKRGQAEESHEKWICDGKSIYEYDFVNKRLYDMQLPPEAQGEGLKNSPLPFVFRAKAADLLNRYWIKDVTPQAIVKSEPQQQYWLECWPKRISDAQAYQRVEIILSADPFLPESIHLYAPNFDEKTNPVKMVFQFEGRQINKGVIASLAGFFVKPTTPFGFKRVKRQLNQDPRDDAVIDPRGATTPRVGQSQDTARPNTNK